MAESQGVQEQLVQNLSSVKVSEDSENNENVNNDNHVEDENVQKSNKSGQNRTRSRSRSKLRAGYEEGNELFDDGKYSEAYKKFSLVFDGRKSSLGPDHEDTLEARNKMALALDADGKYDLAFKMYSEVYAGRKKVLGEGTKKLQSFKIMDFYIHFFYILYRGSFNNSN